MHMYRMDLLLLSLSFQFDCNFPPKMKMPRIIIWCPMYFCTSMAHINSMVHILKDLIVYLYILEILRQISIAHTLCLILCFPRRKLLSF